jgi:trk system potassium uptake protein TrkA
VIFSKGDTGSHMYFCVEGSLKVMSSDGKRVINTIQAGGFFGEVALFTRFKRNATVKATTFCLLKEISQEELNQVLQSFPLVH